MAKLSKCLEEFDETFMVPLAIQGLISEGILEDQSWHNDACPSFYCESTDRAIYVDHPDPEQRECGGIWPRFTVEQYEDGQVVSDVKETNLYAGDDLGEALKAMGIDREEVKVRP